jgi:hypothetical protein
MLTRLPSAAVQMSCDFADWCSGKPVYLYSGDSGAKADHHYWRFARLPSALIVPESDEVSSWIQLYLYHLPYEFMACICTNVPSYIFPLDCGGVTWIAPVIRQSS